MQQILHICTNCLPTDTASAPDDTNLVALQNKLQASGLDIIVKPVDCLNVCSAPAAMSLQAAGLASYVFSDINVEEDGEAILATCKAHLNAESGWIEDATQCGRLRFCLVARLPATL